MGSFETAKAKKELDVTFIKYLVVIETYKVNDFKIMSI
jgi:hypothetical protein